MLWQMTISVKNVTSKLLNMLNEAAEISKQIVESFESDWIEGRFLLICIG